ncbi:hypothetical protein BpHYR1_019344 [Brachionus plicatilis]|uniref:Uncharacterized protein n=1 Tax=Brachionus plicatilis TaxID=10195 RepID=A0A3M7Q5Z4_BRAPC|nr:hypothetical protein BpHYR1_019344 [Brachionus plicatilis]
MIIVRKFLLLLIFISIIVYIVLPSSSKLNNSEINSSKKECRCSENSDNLDSKNTDLLYKESSLRFTCNIDKVLRHGSKQKVVSYSLYGKDKRYYRIIQDLPKLTKQFYPDFLIRIYHDDSIDRSIICKIECEFDHVDFCDISKIQLKDSDTNLNQVHSMIWRFFPLGDSFVDVFMSRDLDSTIIQREKDSVEEWLNSDNIGHIMRDNPAHGTHILGGMWGLKVGKNHSLSNALFDTTINKNLIPKYNPNGQSSRGYDQYFLSHHVYGKINHVSTVHDSYLCQYYSNSKPFPTKREGGLFVGRVTGWANPNDEDLSEISMKDCPVACRPKDHLDWVKC